MDQPRTLPARGASILMALCTTLLLYRLGAVPLVGPDEPRYSRVAIEMKRSGDLVTPTLQGEPWLEKPILYYWLAAAAFSVLGENEAAARLPSVLGLLATVAWTAILGARLYGSRAGLLAGFITGTSLLMFAYGRAASMDMLLTATLTMGLALLALRRHGIAGPAAAVVGAGALGLATLAKGPLGILLPALVLVPHWFLTRKRAAAPPLVTPGSIAAFVVVALPWYALVTLAQGWSFVDTFFLNHNVERFTSTVHNHPGPFFYYVPVLLLGLFPWSVFLLPAAARFDRTSSADLFLAGWALVPLAFFSAAGSKLPGYILPVVPPLAILMGRGAADLMQGVRHKAAVRAAVGLSLVLAVVVGAGPWLARVPSAELRYVISAPAVWGAVVMLVVATRLVPAPVEATQVLRAGAAGFLLLLATVAPAVLRHIESGRDLFVPMAQGRDVLTWGAWRTAWMAGYFYNDARVRPVDGLAAIAAEAEKGPVLVVCGPGERNQLEAVGSLTVSVLATGPRRNVLLEVQRRR